ncbi:ACT domain-containing protein, partial [candidate division FCPU426 bacterium]|nr:ACT domain-containing protein [candidate division FCPU426 bacterium]
EIGVIAKIAGILSEKGISIGSVIQKDAHRENVVPIVIMTYEATEQNIDDALKMIDQMSFTVQPTLKIRVENFE